MPGMHNNAPAGSETDIKVLSEYLMSRSQDEWARAFSISTTASFYATAAFLELLDLGNKKTVENGGGPSSQVVLTGSISGFTILHSRTRRAKLLSHILRKCLLLILPTIILESNLLLGLYVF